MTTLLDAIIWQWPLALVAVIVSTITWLISSRSPRTGMALLALQLTLAAVVITTRVDPAPNANWPVYHNEAASLIMVLMLTVSGAGVAQGRRRQRPLRGQASLDA